MPFLLTVVLFCTAALVFPMGFYIDVVGGQRYKLPNNTVVGSSYILFILSIFFTIVGLLFAGKVCLPGWPGRGSSLFVGLDRALEEGSAGLGGLVFFSCKNTKIFGTRVEISGFLPSILLSRDADSADITCVKWHTLLNITENMR